MRNVIAALAAAVLSATIVAPDGLMSDGRLRPAAAATAHPSPFPTPWNASPVPADDIVNSIGLNTSFGFRGWPSDVNFGPISNDLYALGVRHLREHGSTAAAWYMARLAEIHAHGIKTSAEALVTPIAQNSAQITSMLDAYGPKYVDYIEPQNEIDGYFRTLPHWAAASVAEQKVIAATIRRNPAFTHIAVLGQGLSNLHYQDALAAANGGHLLDAYQNYGNLHYSSCSLNPGTQLWPDSLPDVWALMRTGTDRPIVTTEAGYADQPSYACYLPDNVIADYVPRQVAERWNAGSPRTYYYAFVDALREYRNLFGAMGLVHEDGTPKPQYTALRSMIAMLADRPGHEPFSPRPIAYTVGGDTANVDHLLIQKSDGRYVLMLWIEAAEWAQAGINAHYTGPIAVPDQTVTLRVGASQMTDYTYTSSQTLAPKTIPATNGTFTFAVSKSISYVIF